MKNKLNRVHRRNTRKRFASVTDFNIAAMDITEFGIIEMTRTVTAQDPAMIMDHRQRNRYFRRLKRG
jgi:hypothetical protein